MEKSDGLRLASAISFAAAAHKRQVRKYTGLPYITHPLAVSNILLGHNMDIEVVTAGVLHDVIEDTNYTFYDLKECFGKRVAKLVVEVTNPANSKNAPNRERRLEINIRHLENISPEGQSIKMADITHNCMDIMTENEKFGEIYLAEKLKVVTALTKADLRLRQLAFNTIYRQIFFKNYVF